MVRLRNPPGAHAAFRLRRRRHALRWQAPKCRRGQRPLPAPHCGVSSRASARRQRGRPGSETRRRTPRPVIWCLCRMKHAQAASPDGRRVRHSRIEARSRHVRTPVPRRSSLRARRPRHRTESLNSNSRTIRSTARRLTDASHELPGDLRGRSDLLGPKIARSLTLLPENAAKPGMVRTTKGMGLVREVQVDRGASG